MMVSQPFRLLANFYFRRNFAPRPPQSLIFATFAQRAPQSLTFALCASQS
jgi:hypothetical protein